MQVVTSCADDGSEGTLRSVVALATSTQIVDLSGLACSTVTLDEARDAFERAQRFDRHRIESGDEFGEEPLLVH